MLREARGGLGVSGTAPGVPLPATDSLQPVALGVTLPSLGGLSGLCAPSAQLCSNGGRGEWLSVLGRASVPDTAQGGVLGTRASSASPLRNKQ